MNGGAKQTLGNAPRGAFDRGLAAQRAGRRAEAVAAYREALAVEPALAAGHFNLGQLLREEGRLDEAAERFATAATLRPQAADVWLHLGLCRELQGDLAAAALCYTEAARLDPGAATAHFNLGNVRKKSGDLDGAIGAFAEAARLLPDSPDVHSNLGNALREAGRLDDAIEALQRAVALRPGCADPTWNLALALLGAGRLAEGWELYERRWAQVGLSGDRALPWPRWRGEPLSGRRILLWREQGLGDEIMFASLVPELRSLGARVTLGADRRLVALLARSLPEVRVVADGEWGDESFDCHSPIGGVARWLRPDLASFRAQWSYLVPDRLRSAAWSDRLGALGGTLAVGICWRSGTRGADRARHYAPLEEWRPLFRLPGVTWVNLQYDECEAELVALEQATGARVHRWAGLDLRDDLESVAALIAGLDLVVTAPTAVAALAGAVGTEVLEVDSGIDWTAFGQSRSPWLPAIQVIRRPGGEPWSAAIREVEQQVSDRLAAARGLRAP
jgi:Tfp pilus assembly protein PilF